MFDLTTEITRPIPGRETFHSQSFAAGHEDGDIGHGMTDDEMAAENHGVVLGRMICGNGAMQIEIPMGVGGY